MNGLAPKAMVVLACVFAGWLAVNTVVASPYRRQILDDRVMMFRYELQATGQGDACLANPSRWSWDHPIHGRVAVAQPDAEPVGLRMQDRATSEYVRTGLPGPCALVEVEAPRFRLRDNAAFLRLTCARIALLCLAVGLSWALLTWPLTRRIRRMRSQAERADHRGVAGRIDAGPSDELGQLARTFNQLSSRADIEIRLREELTTQLRERLRWLAHEVRTPLSTMSMLASRLDDESATKMRLEVSRLRHIVGNFSILARIGTNELGLARDRVDLNRVARHVSERYRPVATDHGIALEVGLTDEVLCVVGDAVALEQIVGNLTMNAIEHARGNVAIVVASSPGCAIIDVRDDGPGFVREQVSDAHSSWEHGNGLAIVERFLDLMGGDVRYARRDEGMAVRIRLPSGRSSGVNNG